MKTPIDRDSATWRRVESWALDQLDKCRTKNDGDLDPIQTARLRGRIAVFKDLLALDKPDPAQQMDDA